MFLAEVVGVQADEAYIDPATGRFCLERAEPIVYSHGEYFALGEALGHFGWSVRKKSPASKSAGVKPSSPGAATSGTAKPAAAKPAGRKQPSVGSHRGAVRPGGKRQPRKPAPKRN